MGPILVHGAYRHGELRVAGIGDRSLMRRGFGRVVGRRDLAVARIAGRHDHHDARPDEPVDFDAERTLAGGEPAGKERIAQTQIEAVHLDVAAELVDALEIADCRQQIAHPAALARPQHPEAHDLAIGGKTENRILVLFIDDRDVVDRVVGPDRLPDLDPALRGRPRLAGDNSRDVGAVADAVDERGSGSLRVGGVDVGEVAVPETAPEIEGLVRSKMRVGAVDAGIRDRPDDVPAGGRESRPRSVAFDRLRRPENQRLHGMILPDLVKRRRGQRRFDIAHARDGEGRQPADRVLGDIGKEIVIGKEGIGDGELVLRSKQRSSLSRQRARTKVAHDAARQRSAGNLRLRPLLEELLEQHGARKRRAAGKAGVHLHHDGEHLGLRRDDRDLSRLRGRRSGASLLGARLHGLQKIGAYARLRHRLLDRVAGPRGVDHFASRRKSPHPLPPSPAISAKPRARAMREITFLLQEDVKRAKPSRECAQEPRHNDGAARAGAFLLVSGQGVAEPPVRRPLTRLVGRAPQSVARRAF